MAQKIVKDGGLNIFVKQCPVASTVVTNDFVNVGAIRGLAGINARLGEDGNYYTSVDTAAEVRFDAVAIAFTAGAPVYITSGGAASATASGNTAIGYATRAKGASSGKLFVQLSPGVTA